MVGYYRLKELGYRLPAGTHILSPEEVAPIADATALLNEAKVQSDKITEDAKAAYQRECARGYEDGLALGRLEAVDRLLHEGSVLDARLRDIEHDLIQVVVSSVRQLIDQFDNTARAEAAVRGALKRMRREKKAELRVSPAQTEHFKGAIGRIVKEFPEVELVDVIEDATLAAPQIILETSIGRVEGDFGRHLAELEDIIRKASAQRANAQPAPGVAVQPAETVEVETA